MNTLFALDNPLVDYTSEQETRKCSDLDCEILEKCCCSKCLCCSVCAAKCDCPVVTKEPNKKIAEILTWCYLFKREAMEFYKLENELESSDESGEDERDNEDTTEDESDDWKEHIT